MIQLLSFVDSSADNSKTKRNRQNLISPSFSVKRTCRFKKKDLKFEEGKEVSEFFTSLHPFLFVEEKHHVLKINTSFFFTKNFKASKIIIYRHIYFNILKKSCLSVKRRC